MKKIFAGSKQLPKALILFLAFVCISFLTTNAQSPLKFSYQSVIRNASNQVVANQQVGVKISIIQGSESGVVQFSERHTPTTNANGLISVIVGNGTLLSGDITALDWANGPFFLKSETDPAGGTNYTITITNQILSVPYALYAKTAETVSNETDPVFSASPAFNVTGTNITNWNTAFGWGNHATQGYIPESRTVTINGTTLDLSSNRTWNVGTVTSVSMNNGITGGIGGTITTSGTIGLTGNALGLHNLSTNGLITRTATGTIESRSIGVSGNGISITNSNAVDGNPTLSLNIGSGETQVAAGNHTHSGLLESGSSGQTLRFDGNSWVGNSLLFNSGTNIGIGTTTPGSTLDVVGQIKSSGNSTYGFYSDMNTNTSPGYGAAFKHTSSGYYSTGVSGEANYTGDGNTGYNFGGYFNSYSTTQDGYGIFSRAYRNTANSTAFAKGANLGGTINGQSGYSYGVEAIASGGNTAYGIHATASGASTNWAGWFDGNVKITGTLNIQGGNPGAGKVLTSDASGNATWSNGSAHFIGEEFGGGIIFYIYDNGKHGLIVSPTDVISGWTWGIASQALLTNAVKNGIGGGLLNTERIISIYGPGDCAAALCANYQGGGFGDWYLPSKDELNLLYLAQNQVGGLTPTTYWSSTESNTNNAWRQNFGNGVQSTHGKYLENFVRAIRTF